MIMFELFEYVNECNFRILLFKYGNSPKDEKPNVFINDLSPSISFLNEHFELGEFGFSRQDR